MAKKKSALVKRASKAEWQKAVGEAQAVAKLLKLKTDHRMKIAAIALRVCQISVGGRRSLDQLTLTKFAKEIGVHGKTLIEWVKMRTLVFNKLTPELQDLAIESHFDTIRNVRADVKEDDPVDVVRAKFKAEADQPKIVKTFFKYIKHVRSILYNVSEPRRISDIDDDALNQMVKICGLIQGALSRELKFRAKWKGRGERFKKQKPIDAEQVWMEALAK